MISGPCPNCRETITFARESHSVVCHHCQATFNVVRTPEGKIRLQRVPDTPSGGAATKRIACPICRSPVEALMIEGEFTCHACGTVFQTVRNPEGRLLLRRALPHPAPEAPVKAVPPEAPGAHFDSPQSSLSPHRAAAEPGDLPESPSLGVTPLSLLAGIVCFLDGLILLGVAILQVQEEGIVPLIGLWNMGVTVAYLIAAWGLMVRQPWSYNMGLGLGIINLFFVCFQLQIANMVMTETGAWDSEQSPPVFVTIGMILLGGDLALVCVLFLLKHAIIPPLDKEDVPVSAVLLAELDDALAQKLINEHERETFIAVYKAFVEKVTHSRSLSVRTDFPVGDERVDVMVHRSLDAMMARVDGPNMYEIYLFRPVIDRDIRGWLDQTVWQEQKSSTVVVCVYASRQAQETAGTKLWRGSADLYALRGDVNIGKGLALKRFRKFYQRWSDDPDRAKPVYVEVAGRSL